MAMRSKSVNAIPSCVELEPFTRCTRLSLVEFDLEDCTESLPPRRMLPRTLAMLKHELFGYLEPPDPSRDQDRKSARSFSDDRTRQDRSLVSKLMTQADASTQARITSNDHHHQNRRPELELPRNRSDFRR
eukprot:1509099-Rhodomonas_salina.2